jgi:S1-C subfamily serine protease
MTSMARWVGSLILLAGLAAAPARAEEWVPMAISATAVFETDLSTVEVKQEVVKSWMRETLPRPQRDPVTHKPYIITLTQRADDCQRRQYALGDYVRRDQSGQTAGSGATGGGWNPVAPGSVAEALWKSVCAVARPPKPEALLKSLTEGDWRSLGQSADKTHALSIKTDEIVKLDNGYVLTFVREEYPSPQVIDGFAVRFIVTASLTDCENEKNAPAGQDAYIAPSLRVKSTRVDPSKLVFVPVAPGTFLGANLRRICGAAKPIKAKAPNPKFDGELYSGTAWGVNKGYLVTSSHVIEGGRTIVVYNNGEWIGDATVVLDDPANDLALLKFTKPSSSKLKILLLAERGASLGRSVFTLGYPEPEALGQRIKMTAGQVSSTTGYQDDARFLQISIPVQEGNSGGPVIGWDGAVLGVVKSKLTRFDDDDASPSPENVNYAVKSSYVRPMLEDLPDLGNYEVVKGGADQDRLVAEARAAVFMLLVSK